MTVKQFIAKLYSLGVKREVFLIVNGIVTDNITFELGENEDDNIYIRVAS